MESRITNLSILLFLAVQVKVFGGGRVWNKWQKLDFLIVGTLLWIINQLFEMLHIDQIYGFPRCSWELEDLVFHWNLVSKLAFLEDIHEFYVIRAERNNKSLRAPVEIKCSRHEFRRLQIQILNKENIFLFHNPFCFEAEKLFLLIQDNWVIFIFQSFKGNMLKTGVLTLPLQLPSVSVKFWGLWGLNDF